MIRRGLDDSQDVNDQFQKLVRALRQDIDGIEERVRDRDASIEQLHKELEEAQRKYAAIVKLQVKPEHMSPKNHLLPLRLTAFCPADPIIGSLLLLQRIEQTASDSQLNEQSLETKRLSQALATTQQTLMERESKLSASITEAATLQTDKRNLEKMIDFKERSYGQQSKEWADKYAALKLELDAAQRSLQTLTATIRRKDEEIATFAVLSTRLSAVLTSTACSSSSSSSSSSSAAAASVDKLPPQRQRPPQPSQQPLQDTTDHKQGARTQLQPQQPLRAGAVTSSSIRIPSGLAATVIVLPSPMRPNPTATADANAFDLSALLSPLRTVLPAAAPTAPTAPFSYASQPPHPYPYWPALAYTVPPPMAAVQTSSAMASPQLHSRTSPPSRSPTGPFVPPAFAAAYRPADTAVAVDGSPIRLRAASTRPAASSISSTGQMRRFAAATAHYGWRGI